MSANSYKAPLGVDGAQAECKQAQEAAALPQATKALRDAGLLPISASDMIKTPPPPIEWIITDLLAARGGASRGFKGDIIAGSKMRKTFFALQLGACVSAGIDFLGVFKIPKPRKVWYLNFELREDFTRERIDKIATSMGANLDKLEISTPAQPYLYRNRYIINHVTGKREWVEGYEDQMIEYVRGMGYELLIVDPQYKLMFPEEEENTGAGLGGLLRWRDRIITSTGASVLMVHHDTKSGGTDKGVVARGAGSGYAGRDYDLRMALDAHKDDDPNHEVLECGSRVRPDPDPVTIVFDSDTFTFSLDDSIPPERKTLKRETIPPAEREKKNREAAETAARQIFMNKAKAVEKRHADTGTDPSPAEYLMGTQTFKSELMQTANLSERPCNEQLKGLLERRVLARQGRLKMVDGKAKLDGATLLIGLPVYVEEYRKSYDLDPDGDYMRGGTKR